MCVCVSLCVCVLTISVVVACSDDCIVIGWWEGWRERERDSCTSLVLLYTVHFEISGCLAMSGRRDYRFRFELLAESEHRHN